MHDICKDGLALCRFSNFMQIVYFNKQLQPFLCTDCCIMMSLHMRFKQSDVTVCLSHLNIHIKPCANAYGRLFI